VIQEKKKISIRLFLSGSKVKKELLIESEEAKLLKVRVFY
jgi:hypothetical protein